VILILLLGYSQAKMDLLISAVFSKFCGSELAASVRAYPVKVQVPIHAGSTGRVVGLEVSILRVVGS